MKLYHGTCEHTFRRIMIHGGIRPRPAGKKGNWAHTIPSNHKAIYLADAYAGYYGLVAASNKKHSGRIAMLEVDVDRLDEKRLAPDEDALEQALHGYDDIEGDMTQRTLYYRKNALKLYGNKWRESLLDLGTVAYYDTIPRSAITRVCLIDKNIHPFLAMYLDPTISLINYRLCGAKYRALTKWFFGEEVKLAELFQLGDSIEHGEKCLQQMPGSIRLEFEAGLLDRRGIEVVVVNE